MKKVLKILGIVLLVIIALIILLVVNIVKNAKIQEQDQKMMIKPDEELIGKHLYIKRDSKEDIDVNIYINSSTEKLPLVINIHGGAFIAGDADTLDTQSDRISKDWNVNVATINYKLLKDDITKEYVIEEIKDTIKYFIENSDKYKIDTDNIYILGYSAGGYYAMASTLELHREGIMIKGQILCYSFISDILDKYNTLSNEQKRTMPNSLFILASGDPLSEASLDYQKVLKNNGIKTEIKAYDNVKHGFIEENNPEYEQLHYKNKTSKSPEAEIIARNAEDYIKNWINSIQ